MVNKCVYKERPTDEFIVEFWGGPVPNVNEIVHLHDESGSTGLWKVVLVEPFKVIDGAVVYVERA